MSTATATPMATATAVAYFSAFCLGPFGWPAGAVGFSKTLLFAFKLRSVANLEKKTKRRLF